MCGKADFQEGTEWLENTLPDLIRYNNPAHKYNAEETGLYYKATLYKQPLTILFVTNWEGTDESNLYKNFEKSLQYRTSLVRKQIMALESNLSIKGFIKEKTIFKGVFFE